MHTFLGAPICDARAKTGTIESWTHHECAPVTLEVQIDPGPIVGFIQGSRSAYERLAKYVTQIREERPFENGASGTPPGHSVRCVEGFDSRGERGSRRESGERNPILNLVKRKVEPVNPRFMPF